RVGGDGEQRVLVHRRGLAHFARAEAAFVHDAVVLHDRHRDAGHVELLAHGIDVGVEAGEARIFSGLCLRLRSGGGLRKGGGRRDERQGDGERKERTGHDGKVRDEAVAEYRGLVQAASMARKSWRATLAAWRRLVPPNQPPSRPGTPTSACPTRPARSTASAWAWAAGPSRPGVTTSIRPDWCSAASSNTRAAA